MALTTPFAQNGDKKAIPQSTSDGSVSFDRGFGSFYALPPEEGGLFIDRAQFNQLMYDTTSQVLENKTAIATQANRINEVNTNLTQSINTKANQATTYTKTEVDTRVNAKIDSTKATKLLTENLVKTVGARGADFATLREALEWASQYSYSGGRFTITLNCNADMPIPGVYLPICEAIIIIDGKNNTFNCNNDYFMTFSPTSLFHSGNMGNTLLIRNFTLNYNGITANTYGCAFQCSGMNVALDNITININNSNISNCLIVNQNANYLIMQNVTINCNGNSNINTVVFAGAFSNIFCTDLVVNTMSLNGQIQYLFSFDNSKGNLHQYNVEKPPYPTDKIVTQIQLYSGSMVLCGNRFNNSKLSIAPNTLTSGGIIFKS